MRSYLTGGRLLAAALILAGLASTTAPTIRAELPPEKQTWREVTTPSFRIFGDVPEGRLRHVGASLERLKAVMDQIPPRGAAQAPVPTYVYVFKTSKSFEPFLWENAQGEVVDAAGFFARRPFANYMAMVGFDRDRSTEIVQHELVHYFLSYNMPGIPLWFNEGLAELYSTFEVVDPYVHTGKILQSHLYWLDVNQMMPLMDLFRVDHSSPTYNENDRRGVFYAQSWLLTHYLLLGKEDGLPRLLHFLDLQVAGIPLEEAFAQAFEVKPEKLEKELRKYLRSPRFTYRRAKIQVDDLKRQFTVRELPRSELLGRLGELMLLRSSNAEKSGEYLEASLALDPNEVRAHVGLGLQAMGYGGSTEAETDYDRAVSHFATAQAEDPGDPTLGYLVAWARSQRGDPPESMRRSLVKVVNANPGLVEAWKLLVWAWRGETDQPENQIRAFEGALAKMPDEVDYAETLLELYRKAGRIEDAQRLVDGYFIPRGLTEGDAYVTFDDRSGTPQAGLTPPSRSGSGDDSTTGDQLARASGLVNEGRYEEALVAFEELHRKIPSNQHILAKLEELRVAVAHNRFIEEYNRAVELFSKYEWKAAAEILEPMLETTEDPERRAKVEKLLGQAREQQRIRGDSGP